MSESVEQTNSIMLDLILRKYSRAYRKHLRKMELERRKDGDKHDQNLLRVLFRGRNREVIKEKEKQEEYFSYSYCDEHCPFYTEEGCGIQNSPPSQWGILKEDPVYEKLLY